MYLRLDPFTKDVRLLISRVFLFHLCKLGASGQSG